MGRRLERKRALVIGGSGGIGAAIVKRLACQVVYLASSEAAYVTGASLSIDGGFTA